MASQSSLERRASKQKGRGGKTETIGGVPTTVSDDTSKESMDEIRKTFGNSGPGSKNSGSGKGKDNSGRRGGRDRPSSDDDNDKNEDRNDDSKDDNSPKKKPSKKPAKKKGLGVENKQGLTELERNRLSALKRRAAKGGTTKRERKQFKNVKSDLKNTTYWQRQFMNSPNNAKLKAKAKASVPGRAINQPQNPQDRGTKTPTVPTKKPTQPMPHGTGPTGPGGVPVTPRKKKLG